MKGPSPSNKSADWHTAVLWIIVSYSLNGHLSQLQNPDQLHLQIQMQVWQIQSTGFQLKANYLGGNILFKQKH